jgi:hypothetical protein
LIFSLVLLACSDGDRDSEREVPEPRPNVQVTQPAAQPTQPSGAAPSDEPVAFQAADGVTLRGHLYAAPGPKRKALVLVSNQTQATLRPHVAEFTGKSIALLTFDPRGVGETGGTANDAALAADIALAAGFLKSRDYAQVYLFGVGASAANAAFIAAGTTGVGGVAGLPAGGNNGADLMRVTAPKLYLAFESDTLSVQNINRAVQAAPEPNTRVILPGQAPADALSAPAVRQAILDFVSK